MKQHLVDTYKQVELTQQQIDTLYFRLKYYVTTSANVDRLLELNRSQVEEYKEELELIKKLALI